MSDDIRVLHYADNTSDKYWAIDTRPNAKGGHDGWYLYLIHILSRRRAHTG